MYYLLELCSLYSYFFFNVNNKAKHIYVTLLNQQLPPLI